MKIQRKVEVEMKRRYSKALEKKRIDELVVGYQVQKMEVKEMLLWIWRSGTICS